MRNLAPSPAPPPGASRASSQWMWSSGCQEAFRGGVMAWRKQAMVEMLARGIARGDVRPDVRIDVARGLGQAFLWHPFVVTGDPITRADRACRRPGADPLRGAAPPTTYRTGSVGRTSLTIVSRLEVGRRGRR